MGWAARPWRARVLEGVEHNPGGTSVPGQPQAFKPRRADKSKAKLCIWCVETPLMQGFSKTSFAMRKRSSSRGAAWIAELG